MDRTDLIKGLAVLDPDIVKLVESSNDKWAKRLSADSAEMFPIITARMPEDYIWKFSSTNFLSEQISSAMKNFGPPDEINTIYWTDFRESMAAIREIFNRRFITLFNSSIDLINKLDILSSACVARSAFELSMWSLYHTSIIQNTIIELIKNPDAHGKVVSASSLQELMVKLIWGTNMISDKEDERKQLNIIRKCFEPLAKHAKSKTGEEYIEATYDVLCDIVHPNQIGNFLFITESSKDSRGLQEIPVSMHQVGTTSMQSISSICGALSWSCQAMTLMNANIDRADREIKLRFNVVDQNLN